MSSSLFAARACGSARAIGALLCAAATPVAAQTLTEAEAIRLALEQPDFIALSENEAVAAREAARSISRFDNPAVSASRSRITGAAGDETEWEIGVAQPIDIAGRRTAARAALNSEADAIDAENLRRREQRVADVRRAYANCVAAGEKAGIAGAYAARLGVAEQRVVHRAEAGDSSIYDLRRTRVETRAAQGEQKIAEGEAHAECDALTRLTGVTDVRPSQALATLANPSRAGVAATSRADLKALESRTLAADQSVRAARRARLPDINVGVGYRQREELGAVSSGPVFSVGVAIPLFNSGGAAVREAEARARARAAELALARRNAEGEIAQAAARARAATDAAAAAIEARDDAARLGASADTAYQSGEITIAELVDAYRAMRDAELSIVEMTGRAVLAAIELDLAQGGTDP